MTVFYGHKEVTQIPVIDLQQAVNNPNKITVSDFIENLSYVRLETNAECLIEGNLRVLVKDENILIITPERCLLFDRRSGAYIREIAHYGRGPGEFQSPYGFFLESTLSYYFEGWKGNLIKYTLDGTYRGDIKIPLYNDEINPSFPDNYSYLDSTNIVTNFLISNGTETNSLMIFTDDGDLLMTFPNNRILRDKQTSTVRPNEIIFHHFNNKLYFQSRYNDTIFQLTRTERIPYLVLDRGKQRPPYESKWWLFDKLAKADFIYPSGEYFENDKYLVFNFYSAKSNYMALYYKELKTLKFADCKSGIENDIDGFVNVKFTSINDDYELVGFIQPSEILSWIENNPDRIEALGEKIPGIKIIDKMDNPVIYIAKFKE